MTTFDISQIPTIFEHKIWEHLCKKEYNNKSGDLKATVLTSYMSALLDPFPNIFQPAYLTLIR